MKLQRMSLAIERAFNAQSRAGNKNENIKSQTIKITQDVENALLEFIAEVGQIESNTDLTPSGKQGRVATATGQIRGQLALLDPRAQLQYERTQVDGKIINAVARAKGITKSGEYMNTDPMTRLAETIQAQEIRQFFLRHRKDSRAAHLEMLAQAKRNSIFLTDEEREHVDPLQTAYLAACKGFGPEARVFINAIEKPPYGVKMLDDETIEKGNELLQQAVAGDFVDVKADISTQIEMADHVFSLAVEVITKPKANQPRDESYTMATMPVSSGPPLD